MVTYADLFQFCLLIVAIVSLVYKICHRNKKRHLLVTGASPWNLTP